MDSSKKRGNPNWRKGGPSPNPSGQSRQDALLSPRADGWKSTITGIGMSGYDKRIGMDYQPCIVQPELAQALWQGNDICAKTVELLPSNMLREGYELQFEGNEGKELAESLADDLGEEGLDLDAHLFRALCFRRAYGGAAIYLGVDDGRTPDEPVDENNIRSFNWMNVLEAREIVPERWYNDFANPKFGQPSRYRLTPFLQGQSEEPQKDPRQDIIIHETRLIPFMGLRVTRRNDSSTGSYGWGDNIFTRMFDVLRDFDTAWSSAGLLVHDFAQPVFKMANLANIVSKDGTEALKARMLGLALSRSIARTMLIDTTEEFKREQTPVSGLPELLDRFATRLACAVDTPVTLLMGMSPAGLNATGESDIRFYYDKVASEQPKQLRKPIRRVATLKALSRGIKKLPQGSIIFNPLWQQTDKEIAEARYIQTQSDEKNIVNQVLTAAEVRKARYSGDAYSFETQIDHVEDTEIENDMKSPETAAQLAAPVGEGAAVAPAPDVAFNGAQIAAMVDVIKSVHLKELSRESAIAILVTSFPVTEEQAARLVGPDITPPKPEPAPAAFGGAASKPKEPVE